MTTNHDRYYPHACCTLQHSISLLTNFDRTFWSADKNVGTLILRVFTRIASGPMLIRVLRWRGSIRVDPCSSVASVHPCRSVFFRGLGPSVSIRVLPWPGSIRVDPCSSVAGVHPRRSVFFRGPRLVVHPCFAVALDGRMVSGVSIDRLWERKRMSARSCCPARSTC